MPYKPGDRVGAILKANKTTVYLLGYGVYEGDHQPPFYPFGATQEEIDALKADGTLKPDWTWKNPRIRLDDGRIVWGAQCWWGGRGRGTEVYRRPAGGPGNHWRRRCKLRRS